MAVNKLARTGRRSALTLALAAVALPGIAAAAEPGGEERGGWRGRGGEAREAPGNIGAGGWQRPAPQSMPERSWAGNGDGNGNQGRAHDRDLFVFVRICRDGLSDFGVSLGILSRFRRERQLPCILPVFPVTCSPLVRGVRALPD